MRTVHIVLATYNAERYLREQLDSILNSDYQDISIEICDDGSTDRTIEMVKEYMMDHADVISLHQNKENIGYQRNFLEGVKRSRSPYIMLCDQDDIWREDKISVTLAKMKELEQEKNVPVLVFTDAVLYDGDTKKELGSFHKTSHLITEKVDIPHLLMENKIIGCTVMVNQKIVPYLEILPQEIRVHDWWMALICSAFGKISYIEYGSLLYRQHSGNIIGGTSFFKYFKNKFASLREQKRILHATYGQADAFYRLFGNELDPVVGKTVKRFSNIPQYNFIKKRILCIRYGYLKSGLIRNMALMLLL